MSTSQHRIQPEELMAYLDGELSATRATEALSHLEHCPDCQHLADDFEIVSEELFAWEVESREFAISPGLSAALDAALQERLQKRQAPRIVSLRFKHPLITSGALWGVALAILCTVVGLRIFLAHSNHSGGETTTYLSMASIDQYLMPDRESEIDLARSAAPKSISGEASILVLGWQGYQTAIEGKNGFVCMVERSWMQPFNSAEFWSPRIRVPICFNPAAARSILPLDIKRTAMVLAGLSRTQMIDSVNAAYRDKELPPPEPGAMCYMMSREGYLSDHLGHHVPHLMFYFPLTDNASWGADLRDSPVTLNPQFRDGPEPITEFVIPVSKWSDGTPAPAM